MPNLDWKVRLQTDQATVQQTSAAAGMLLGRMRDMQVETKRLRADADDLSASFRTFASSAGARAALADAKQAAKSLADEFVRVENEAKGAAKEIKEVGRAQTGQTTPRANISSLSRSSGAIGSVGRGADLLFGAGALDFFGPGQKIGQAIYGLQALNAELPELAKQFSINKGQIIGLTSALGVAGLAYYAITEVQKDQEAELKRVKEAWQQIIDQTREFYGLVLTGTTADVENAINAKKQELAIAQSTADSIKQNLDEARAALEKAEFVPTGRGRGVHRIQPITIDGETIDSYTELRATVQTLTDQYDQQKNIIGPLESDLGRLQGGLTNVNVLLNDWNTVLKQAQSAQVNRMEAEVRYAITARKMTAEQIRDRIDQIHDEQFVREQQQRDLERLAPTSEVAAQQLQAVNVALANLTLEGQQLYEALPGADEIARQQQAGELLNNIIGIATDGAKAFTGVAEDMTASLDDSAERLEDYYKKTSEVLEDRAIKSQREQQDFERERLNDLADHYADMADLDAEYYDERQGVLDSLAEDLEEADQERLAEIADYNKESRRLTEDHKDEILRIQREMNRDYNEAARARDTAGALAVLRQGEQRLEDEQAGYTKEQARRKEDLRDLGKDLDAERRKKIEAAQKELRDLEVKHRKERDAKERAFQVQLQREDEQRRIAAQRQQEDWNREDQARRSHFDVVETDTSTHYTNLKTISEIGFGAIEGFVSTAWSGLVAGLAALPTPTPGAPPAPYVPTDEGHYGFAGGGFPPLHRRVQVGEQRPETAVFASGARETIGLRGRENAVFTEPVRIYPSARAMPSALTVNLGGLGGVQIQAGAGMSARSLAQQAGRQLDSLVVDALERIINNYAGGL